MLFQEPLAKGNYIYQTKKSRTCIFTGTVRGQLEQGFLHKTEFTGMLKLSCYLAEHKHPWRKGISCMAHKAFQDDQELTCRQASSDATLGLSRTGPAES